MASATRVTPRNSSRSDQGPHDFTKSKRPPDPSPKPLRSPPSFLTLGQSVRMVLKQNFFLKGKQAVKVGTQRHPTFPPRSPEGQGSQTQVENHRERKTDGVVSQQKANVSPRLALHNTDSKSEPQGKQTGSPMHWPRLPEWRAQPGPPGQLSPQVSRPGR